MSRRQTLGVLSPSALNSRANQAGRILTGKEGSQSTASALNGASVPGKGRKSMAPTAENRPSAVGLGVDRRSSAFGGKPTGPKQDPRPLSDKNFLNNCVHTLITYLSLHGYPAAVSPKTLASPTAKDFTMVVQFLFQRFDSNMKTFGKIEDEVPVFFKRLNYPFQISKSALFAVGSPHSWPAVLAALTWLVELLNYNEKADENSGCHSSKLMKIETVYNLSLCK
jgi:kinetochore protein NDC80